MFRIGDFNQYFTMPSTDGNFTCRASSTTGSKTDIFTEGRNLKANNQNQNTTNDQEIETILKKADDKFAQCQVPSQVKKAEDIKQVLGGSGIPNMPIVGDFIYTGLNSLAENLNSLYKEYGTKSGACKTKSDAQSLCTEIIEELKQIESKANTYMQRGKKAIALNNKMQSIFNDPEKAKFAEKLDLGSITDNLMQPVEDNETNNTEEIEGNDGVSASAEISEQALQDDESSKIVDAAIKYINTGETDTILSNYIKNDTPNEGNRPQTNPFNTPNAPNPFSQNLPYFQKITLHPKTYELAE